MFFISNAHKYFIQKTCSKLRGVRHPSPNVVANQTTDFSGKQSKSPELSVPARGVAYPFHQKHQIVVHGYDKISPTVSGRKSTMNVDCLRQGRDTAITTLSMPSVPSRSLANCLKQHDRTRILPRTCDYTRWSCLHDDNHHD